MHCNKKVKQRQTNKLEKERERPWVLGDRPIYLSFDMPAKKNSLGLETLWHRGFKTM